MSATTDTMAETLQERIRARLVGRAGELRAVLGQHPERVFVHPLDHTRATPHLDWYTAGANRNHPRPWPSTLPLPLTFGQALEAVERGAGGMAEQLAAKITAAAQLVVRPSEYVEAALARDFVTDRWPWPRRDEADTPHPGWIALYYLERAEPFRGNAAFSEEARQAEERARRRPLWPNEIAPLDAAVWAHEALNALPMEKGEGLPTGKMGDDLEGYLRAGNQWFSCMELPLSPSLADETLNGNRLHLPTYGLGLLYLAAQDVERGRKRRAIALDANREHHGLLGGWSDFPKQHRDGLDVMHHEGRIELLAPGDGRPRVVQLSLDLGGEETVSEALAQAIREVCSPMGLRHWAALQRLLSVEGGREGWVRWTLDAHLEAMGYSPKERSRLKVREATARAVETFTKLQLGVYDDSGTLRQRLPLVLVGQRTERLKGSKWRLDGMTLEINPLLYRGVRDQETRRLGENWHPAPIELPQVDHVRHPYTLSLGLILPIRWRLALNGGRRDVTLRGRQLLRLAGIRPSRSDPGKAWKALRRDLAELQRIGGLARWEWLDGEDTMEGRVRLYPPAWIADRTGRGVTPWERPPAAPVLTGDELREWRKVRGLSQARAAQALGVGEATVKRAEATPSAQLGKTLRDALQAAG